MWLAGALQQKGAPALPVTLDARRVAAFWVMAELMKHLSLPVRSVDLEDTRLALLIRVHVLSRGIQAQKDPLVFVKHIGEIEEAVPGADVDTIVPILAEFYNSPRTITPELTDEAFGRILVETPESDLRHFARRVAMSHRAFRLSTQKAGEGYSFLAQTPPVPRVLLQERAMSGAAYLSSLSLQDRFDHIFSYPETLWYTEEV